jgi:hypothetical protein
VIINRGRRSFEEQFGNLYFSENNMTGNKFQEAKEIKIYWNDGALGAGKIG